MRNANDLLNPTMIAKDPLFFPTPLLILQAYILLQNKILSFAHKFLILLFTLPEYLCFILYLTPTQSLP